jgi:hypothetical protein
VVVTLAAAVAALEVLQEAAHFFAAALHMEALAVHMAADVVAHRAFREQAAEALSASFGPVQRAPSHRQTQGTYKWQLFQAFFLR